MKDLAIYDQAVQLKELGFDWECIHWYRVKEGHNLGLTCMYDTHNTSEKGIPAPTLSQAQKWFREVKGLDISISHVYHRLDTGDKVMYSLHIGDQSTFKTEFYLNYESYEEALSAGINVAIKILKNK